MKKVYVGMSADYLHIGHINLLNEAKKYGSVIVGLLTDEAIASYKRIPMTNYENRKKMVESIAGIQKVVPQHTFDYTDNLIKYKPDFVVHGTDWRTGIQKNIRQKVIDTIKEWNGKLVEPPYTTGISSTGIIEKQMECGVTPIYRLNKLRRLIELKPIVRVIEAHSGLSSIIAERTKFQVGNEIREFDAFWESSLTDSMSKGKPDIEIVDFTSRTQTINQILEVTTKPMIIVGDTGGTPEHFSFMVKTLERLGVSAVIIEDKQFPKQNSLLPNVKHQQETILNFCAKIQKGKQSQVNSDFMIFARIESLIAGKSVDDALERAKAYIQVGADGIMIHSKYKSPGEILEFCEEYKKFKHRVPLIAVPTTYNTITEKEPIDAGVSIVIYANHLLRSSYKAMMKTAEAILQNERAYEAESTCCPVKQIFDMIR